MKRRLLIFTDCYTYGGSERLMVFLLKNEIINENYQIILSYRYYREYHSKLITDLKKLNIKASLSPLKLLANDTLFNRINSKVKSKKVRLFLKLPFFIAEKLGFYFLWNAILFFFFLRKAKPELIHINNGGYPGALSCSQLACVAHAMRLDNVVYQVNNIALQRTSFISHYYDKMLESRVKYFITASQRAKDALSKACNFDIEKIAKIPNTVLLEKPGKTKSQILKEANWPETTFLIAQIAFLSERKGQIYLLQAMKLIQEEFLLEKNINIKVALVGNGEDEIFLKNYVEKNKLTSQVYFAGYRPNSVDYINAADLFVLPSIANEDMPLALLTAMSFGKAIIATNFAGIAEAIKNKENGILLPLEKQSLTKNLKTAIIELYNNNSLRTKMGEHAFLTFKANYSENIYGTRLHKLYTIVLNI